MCCILKVFESQSNQDINHFYCDNPSNKPHIFQKVMTYTILIMYFSKSSCPGTCVIVFYMDKAKRRNLIIKNIFCSFAGTCLFIQDLQQFRKYLSLKTEMISNTRTSQKPVISPIHLKIGSFADIILYLALKF